MKKTLSIFILFLTTLHGHAENLTLNDCLVLARNNYPSISSYGIIDKIEQFNLSNASKAWLPQGTVSGQLTWQNDVAAWPEKFSNMLAQQGIDFSGIDKTQYRVGLDINQQIWDGGKSSAERRAIESASVVERKSLDVELYEVEGRVQEIYFGILLLEGRIRNLENSETLVDSTFHQMKSMRRNGVATQSDCDQIEAQLLSLEQQKSRLLATCGSYRRVLEIFIGQPTDGRELSIPATNPESTSDRPQMQLFDSQITSILSKKQAIQASLMPQIGAFATGYYGYTGFNMFRNMQNHDPSFNFMVGINVSWNFGSLYTRSNSLHKLEFQRQQIETDRETFLFNNRILETEAASQIAALREVMRNDERIVTLRRSVINAAQSKLRNGIIDATALLSKITDAEMAENDLILHEIELVKALYNLNHIQNR